jgi:hypothetical protein
MRSRSISAALAALPTRIRLAIVRWPEGDSSAHDFRRDGHPIVAFVRGSKAAGTHSRMPAARLTCVDHTTGVGDAVCSNRVVPGNTRHECEPDLAALTPRVCPLSIRRHIRRTGHRNRSVAGKRGFMVNAAPKSSAIDPIADHRGAATVTPCGASWASWDGASVIGVPSDLLKST